jgi:hypothetical protein
VKLINRAVAVIKPRQRYVDWALSLPDAPDELSLEDVRTDCTTILIPEYDTPDESEAFIAFIAPELFEAELDAWYRDRTSWLVDRDYGVFQEWFDVEIHSVVVDAGKNTIRRKDF